MSPFTLIVTISIAVGLCTLPSSTDAECCVNSRSFKCCGVTENDCNFFCCGCNGGCGDRCEFNFGEVLGTLGRQASKGINAVGNGIGYLKNKTLETFAKRSYSQYENRLARRSVPSSFENTVNAFDTVDLNSDRVIDYDEGLAFLQNSKISHRSPGKRVVKREDLVDFNEQFQKLDRNNDGVIEPHEFDPSLA